MWVPRIEFRSPGLVARGFSPAESSSSLYFYYPDVVGPNHTSHVLIASTFHSLCWKMPNRILLSSLCGLPHSSPFCFQAFIRTFFFDKLKVWDRIVLCSPGWPTTLHVSQFALNLSSACLGPEIKCAPSCQVQSRPLNQFTFYLVSRSS